MKQIMRPTRGGRIGDAMASLVYVSCCTLDQHSTGPALEEIRLASLARNSLLDVTGFLIATPAYFVQLLEGGDAALDALMSSIVRDPRHRDVVVIERVAGPARSYPRWSMACFGPGSFISKTVHPVLDALHRGDKLIDGSGARALLHQLVPGDSATVPRFDHAGRS